MSVSQLIGLVLVVITFGLGFWLLYYFKKRLDKLFYLALSRAMTAAFILLLLQSFFLLINSK
jgi:hypothetical protein